MSLDSRKLRYFVAVYEEGSATRAAERENIVQPALSVHLRQLEEELGQKLFERSAQGMHPTPAAHEFYGYATDLIQRMRDIRQRMLDGGRRLSGPLRVGLMPSVCRGLLDVIRTSFVDQHAAVSLTLLEATSGALAEAVASGRLDLAIANAPATALRLRLLRRDPVVLAAGTRARFRGETLHLSDLVDVQLVLPSSANTIRRLLDMRLKAAAIVPARFVEIDGLDATMRFVADSA